MFAALIALLAQNVDSPVTAVPPPIVRPPIMITPSASRRIATSDYRSADPPIRIGVRATAGSRVLLADDFRVDTMIGANFTQSRSEAPLQQCAGPDQYSRQHSTTFNLRLNVRPNAAGQRLMSVSVSWTRPMEGANCVTSGTRGASIEQNVTIEPGKPVVLTGDGGLRVELTPR